MHYLNQLKEMETTNNQIQCQLNIHVQGRILQTILSLITELRWPSLEDRRRIARTSMMYKIHHNLACVENIKGQLHPLPGHNQQFVLPQCRTQYHQNSFLPRTIKQWNQLPQEVIEANTIDTFVSRASRQE